LAGRAVHRQTGKSEVYQLIKWYEEYEAYIASRAAVYGLDFRTINFGVMVDLIYAVFVDLCMAEHGDKKLEIIKKINTQFRGEPVIKQTIMPDTKPVNE
jgi:hypothetical protein